jgi:hypothetical protein
LFVHLALCTKKAWISRPFTQGNTILNNLSFSLLCIECTGTKNEYKVIFRGDSVGNMQLCKNKQEIIFLLNSFPMYGYVFYKSNSGLRRNIQLSNGRLIYSNVSRIVNGKEKAAKQIKTIGNTYEATSFGKTVPSTIKSIDYNLNMLYFQEPFNNKLCILIIFNNSCM